MQGGSVLKSADATRWRRLFAAPRPGARKLKKPPELAFGVDDIPPRAVGLLSALQQLGNIAASLVIPLVICSQAGVPSITTASIISFSFLALSLAAVLQALPRSPVGSGYLALSNFSALFIEPSVAAVALGGLPLMYGMTAFAGVLEAVLSGLVRRVRPFFPPELAGVVTFLLGIGAGLVGLREVLALHHSGTVPGAHWAAALVTLATIVGLNVWTRGLLRMCCVLIGMVAGYATALAGGLVTFTPTHSGLLAIPSVGHLGLSFDGSLVVPFAIMGLVSTIKTMAVVTTCQRTNDAGWVRADLGSISRGTLADGLGLVVCGLLGTPAINTAPSSVGLAAATGVTSRRVAFITAALMLPLAFIPAAALLFSSIPAAVAGATLMFTSSFVIISGVEMMASRLLDSRRMLVIAASILAAEGSESFPAYMASLPHWAHTVTVSPLLLGTVVALALNLLFRIGIRRTSVLDVQPGEVDPGTIQGFMEAHGASWGARSEVIQRAAFALGELVDSLGRGDTAGLNARVEASFDEFSLDLRVSWQGPLPPFPTSRPSFDAIADSHNGLEALSGFLIRRHTDGLRATRQGTMAVVDLHFDH